MPNEFEEKRVEPRKIIDEFYSVEFSIKDFAFTYQFRIWDVSEKGICVLVKEDSSILGHLKVGDTWNMKYYRIDSELSEYMDTEIRHITKDETGRFEGHYLVGLSILNP